MWMGLCFGCGIFPHKRSHQSRLTGHWLHSITERPGLEKENTHKRQMSSLKPCTTPISTLHMTENCSFLYSHWGTRVCSYRASLRGNAPILFTSRSYTVCRRTNLFFQNPEEEPMCWQITWYDKDLSDTTKFNTHLTPWQLSITAVWLKPHWCETVPVFLRNIQEQQVRRQPFRILPRFDRGPCFQMSDICC